jgi:hypothetical protein
LFGTLELVTWLVTWPTNLQEALLSYVVAGGSVDGVLVDAFSCLILAAVALALFPRKRFRMSSLKGMRKGVYAEFEKGYTMPRLHSNVARRRDLHSSGNSSR